MYVDGDDDGMMIASSSSSVVAVIGPNIVRRRRRRRHEDDHHEQQYRRVDVRHNQQRRDSAQRQPSSQQSPTRRSNRKRRNMRCASSGCYDDGKTFAVPLTSTQRLRMMMVQMMMMAMMFVLFTTCVVVHAAGPNEDTLDPKNIVTTTTTTTTTGSNSTTMYDYDYDYDNDYDNYYKHMERKMHRDLTDDNGNRTDDDYSGGIDMDEVRIINGKKAGKNQFPYFVQGLGCGAVLVARDVVLSAAHCFGAFSRGFPVLVGAMDSKDPSVGDAEYRTVLSPQYKHPSYRPQTDMNDLLIFRIEPVTKPHLQPIPLAINPSINAPQPGTMLRVVGMGSLNAQGTKFDHALRYTNVKAFPFQVCNTRYNKRLNGQKQLCAASTVTQNGRSDSCFGDSGGPLIAWTTTGGGNGSKGRKSPSQPKKQVLAGITSFGTKCNDPYHPGVYSKVAGNIQWIRTSICRLTQVSPKPAYCQYQQYRKKSNKNQLPKNSNNFRNGVNVNMAMMMQPAARPCKGGVFGCFQMKSKRMAMTTTMMMMTTKQQQRQHHQQQRSGNNGRDDPSRLRRRRPSTKVGGDGGRVTMMRMRMRMQQRRLRSRRR